MEITDVLKSRLSELGVDLNTTLVNTIEAGTDHAVLNAVDALKEAIASGQIERPGGWLKRAIDRQWKPNRPDTAKATINQFKQWYDLAYQQGLVIASMKQQDGQLVVFDNAGVPHFWTEMLAAHPLESLQAQDASSR